MNSIGLKGRAIILTLYTITAYFLYANLTTDWSLQSYTVIWFVVFSAFISYDLVVVKFFVKPHDSLITTISVYLLLVTMEKTQFDQQFLVYRKVLTFIVILLMIVSLINSFMINKKSVRNFTYKFTQVYGKPETLFLPLLILISFAYFSKNIFNVLTLNVCWIIYLFLKPHHLLYLVNTIKDSESIGNKDIGLVVRVDTPNILLVKLNNDLEWMDHQYSVEMSSKKWVQVIPLHKNYKSDGVYGTGYYFEIERPKGIKSPKMKVIKSETHIDFVEEIQKKHKLLGQAEYIGVVVENSVVEKLIIEVTSHQRIKLGCILFLPQPKHEIVYYQVTSIRTVEEVYDSEPRGKLLVEASQLGIHEEGSGFKKYNSLPRMNEMIFSLIKKETADTEDEIGFVINTNMPVKLNSEKLLKYHGAVLGVTGTGKTELVFKIIENSLNDDVKVFCVDITGDYVKRLDSYNPKKIQFDSSYTNELDEYIFAAETGNYGGKTEKGEFLKYVESKQNYVYGQINDFLTSEEHNLAIFELSDISNSRTSLRITQMYLSNLFKWAKENRNKKDIQIVLEEAHTIIPERNSFGFDNVDTDAVLNSVSQIALQGRKYGVGLLVVSQRTALVSKTILSQCNTFFTFNLIDKTSLEFLKNVYGETYIKTIINLKFRHMLAFGNAINSENPILVEIPYDKRLEDASKVSNS